jgi:hypothetical protein
MISNENTRVGYLPKAPGSMYGDGLGVIVLGKRHYKEIDYEQDDYMHGCLSNYVGRTYFMRGK